MHDPCVHSPGDRHARIFAHFYAQKFDGGSVVVDIGCGQGYFLQAARERGIRAIGVDRDERLVRSAKERGYEAIAGDVRDVRDLIGETVDGVVGMHIIEHLEPDDLRDLLADSAALVRPGGKAVWVTPNPRDLRTMTEWFWNDPTHVRPYMPRAVGELCDPREWVMVRSGLGPRFVTRDLPLLMLRRLRFGSHYGRAEHWVELARA